MLLRTIFSPLEIDMRNSSLTIITHKLIEGAAKIFTAAVCTAMRIELPIITQDNG